jgi:spermidine synthase
MNKKIIGYLFALSGMTALIYEIIWSRTLELIFGSTIYAISTILATFFIGFSLGSYFFRNVADKSKNPLKLFGFIQIGIGLSGAIILTLFKTSIILDIFLGTTIIPIFQFILLFFILIAPTTLFGATWPIISKEYIEERKIGEDAGTLYYFNSIGSFLGPILGGFILIPLLGVKITLYITILVNIFMGIYVLIFNKKDKNGN